MESDLEPVELFYKKFVKGDVRAKEGVPCPFCEKHGKKGGRLVVILNADSYFHSYFRCTSSCVPGGFIPWFAKLSSIPASEIPGYNTEQDDLPFYHDFPVENLNAEVAGYQDRLGDSLLSFFRKKNVSPQVLKAMGVGFNGRYIVYPYFQEDGNCYSARCVYPEKIEDYFWQGDERYSRVPYTIFNRDEIAHCEQGALFICDEENTLLTLKQLGFPAVAVPHHSHLEKLPIELFERIHTLFVAVTNSIESRNSAYAFASRVGFKVRILPWAAGTPIRYSFTQLAEDSGKLYGKRVAEMIKGARSFSPFASPATEYKQFLEGVRSQQTVAYKKIASGFSLLDDALGGIHGINIIGGAPKVGKSTFTIQIGSEMARQKIPVLYYDFENGRQKIYQRTLSRLSRIETSKLANPPAQCEAQLKKAQGELENILFYWRVINDRAITPELMRKHVEFIRHETRSEYTVVIIDSLHKLPFKEFGEQRTGIDAWLREMESIRDELKVSFLVISELSRGAGDSYEHTPHLGVFKGSGDIEYSADNAMVLYPGKLQSESNVQERKNPLWLVASREHSPGRVAEYQLDFPYWGFVEYPTGGESR
jgi:replicative DNA helicase